MSKGKDDEQRTHQGGADVREVQHIESLQTFQDSPEDAKGKARGYRRTYHQKQQTGSSGEICWNLENRAHVKESNNCNQHRHKADSDVTEHGCVDQTIQLIVILEDGILGHVADDGRANS